MIIRWISLVPSKLVKLMDVRPASELSLAEAAEGYRAMDARRAIKTLLRV